MLEKVNTSAKDEAFENYKRQTEALVEDLKAQVRSLEKKREDEQARADGAIDELEEARVAAQRREKELKDELA